MPHTPEIYYMYSESFDFRRYMEERSHFDRIEWSIDQQTAELLTGNQNVADVLRSSAAIQDKLQNELNEKVSSLGTIIAASSEVLEDKLGALSFDLQDISRDIELLRTICGLGFDGVIKGIAQTNDHLSEISDTLKSPSRAWAQEQFDMAAKLASRSKWEEAIKRVGYAIDGYGQEIGYPIEPRFHFFRGGLFSGAAGTDPPLIDLKRASADYQNAALHAKDDDLRLTKEALTWAAFCEYGAGRLEDARALAEEAIGISIAFTEADFQHARICFHLGDNNAARSSLINSFMQDPSFFPRAKNDRVFDRDFQLVNECAREARDRLIGLIKKVTNRLKLQIAGQLIEEKEFPNRGSRELRDAVEALNCAASSSSLVGAKDSHQQLSSLQDAYRHTLRQYLNECENHLKRHGEAPQKPERGEFNHQSEIHSFGMTIIGAFVFGAFSGIWVLIEIWASEPALSAILATIFMVPIAAIVGAAIGAGGGLLIGLVRDGIAASAARSEFNKQEAERLLAYKQRMETHRHRSPMISKNRETLKHYKVRLSSVTHGRS